MSALGALRTPDDTVALLEHDADLAAAVPESQRAALVRALRCATVEVPVGPWHAPSGRPDLLGLLVLEGMVVHRLQAGHARAAEILGPGDVLRPWQEADHELTPAAQARWVVAEPARLAVVDGAAIARAGACPELVVALCDRFARRARELAYLAALSHLVKVHERLLRTLWHLAERFGRVTPRGVALDLPLTHEVLAELVGAQRPSLTTSLTTLERRGLVSREGRTYVLHGAPPAP